MARRAPSRIALGVVVAMLAVVPLSACATDAPAAGGGSALTLAQVKSPVQLLRNSAAGRIDKSAIDEVKAPTDQSQACKGLDVDPKSLYRTWVSGVLILLKYDEATRPPAIQTQIIRSFTDQGWKVGDSPSTKITHLEKATTFATIDISNTDIDKTFKVEGQIQINVYGACVLTGGPTSPEVTKLEKVG
ncbi:hypothetical protein BH11ACT2_BH11ACT2_11030 [soil metagenome]